MPTYNINIPAPEVASVISAATKGGADKSLTIQYDAKGRLLLVSENSIQITESQVTGLTSDLASKVNKTGDNLSGPVNANKAINVASASTTNIGSATGEFIHITGTNTITAFDSVQAGTMRTVVFDGVLTLTHNSTSLILPGAGDIVTAANDIAVFRSEGSGNWRCTSYVRYDESYTNYTPTWTGYSSIPTVNAGEARWKMLSKNTCHVIVYPSLNGTSNATTQTITLPFNAANSGSFGLQSYCTPVFNNGSYVNGSLRLRSNSNIADVYNGAHGAAFTASGAKAAYISIVYQIQI